MFANIKMNDSNAVISVKPPRHVGGGSVVGLFEYDKNRITVSSAQGFSVCVPMGDFAYYMPDGDLVNLPRHVSISYDSYRILIQAVQFVTDALKVGGVCTAE